MNNGIPNTPEKLDRCFIVKAATNSAVALQMAQQIWTDPEQAGYELVDFVEVEQDVPFWLGLSTHANLYWSLQRGLMYHAASRQICCNSNSDFSLFDLFLYSRICLFFVHTIAAFELING